MTATIPAPLTTRPEHGRLHRLFVAGAVLVLGLLGVLATTGRADAHPMPHSIVAMHVGDDRITAQLEVPLDDLTLAMDGDPTGGQDELTAEQQEALASYLDEHVSVATQDGEEWTTTVDDVSVSEAEQTSTGEYREVTATATFTPPAGASLRQFVFTDTAVIHNVVTHKILVQVDTDWAGGSVATEDEGGEAQQVGVIKVDTRNGDVAPLDIDLDDGSVWNGAKGMFSLGMNHILEGTDHLMFLLVLLLPAPLLASAAAVKGWRGLGRRRWDATAPVKTTVKRILAITISFTIGHSLTLIIASLLRLDIVPEPVEALIAVSILVGALHALRPLFPGRETLIAGLFGLIHGTAFSFTLAELDLSTKNLLISLVSFNVGIEVMQLIVVALVLPALVITSRTKGYHVERVVLAVIVAVAAVGWVFARLGTDNAVADAADTIVDYQYWFLAAIWVYALAWWVAAKIDPRWRSESATDVADASDGADNESPEDEEVTV